MLTITSAIVICPPTNQPFPSTKAVFTIFARLFNSLEASFQSFVNIYSFPYTPLST